MTRTPVLIGGSDKPIFKKKPNSKSPVLKKSQLLLDSGAKLTSSVLEKGQLLLDSGDKLTSSVLEKGTTGLKPVLVSSANSTISAFNPNISSEGLFPRRENSKNTPLQKISGIAGKQYEKQNIRENNSTITVDVPPQLREEITNDFNISEMFADYYIKSYDKLRRLRKIRIKEFEKQKKLQFAKLKELSNARNNKIISDVWKKGVKIGTTVRKGVENLKGTRDMTGKTDEEKETITNKSIERRTRKTKKGISNFFGTMKKAMRSLGKTCFHPDTLVRLKNNSLIKMKDLSLNAILKDGSRVISVMKISNLNDNNKQNEIFYKIKSGEDNNDILVTGTHMVYDDSIKKYIKVAELKSAVKTKVKSKEVSCLVTSNNKILLGEWIFSDWEEIY